jgi:hypothetical protein
MLDIRRPSICYYVQHTEEGPEANETIAICPQQPEWIARTMRRVRGGGLTRSERDIKQGSVVNDKQGTVRRLRRPQQRRAALRASSWVREYHGAVIDGIFYGGRLISSLAFIP